MGRVTIRYYVTRKREGCPEYGYWDPSAKMKAYGFDLVSCGEDGPAAWAIAELQNERWNAFNAELKLKLDKEKSKSKPARIYPLGSIGHGFERFKKTGEWLTGKKERTRDDWERGWRYIEPYFGDVDPTTVSLEELDLWYYGDAEDPQIPGLLKEYGVREAHRAVKIWRALWQVLGTMSRTPGSAVKYCEKKNDPSLGIRRKTPKARNAFWYEGEAVRLIKKAWRMDYRGLAAALAVSWDTMLSPVDVRELTLAKLRGDSQGPLFAVDRAKTGKAAIGTLSKRTVRLVEAYIASLPFILLPDTPIFHTRGKATTSRGGRPQPPAPYTKDTLSKDFRVVRKALLPKDDRKVSDFRRSGAIEAVAGEVDRGALAGKMANSIDDNRELEATYLPHQATIVRMADKARSLGRSRMRGAGNKEPGK